MARGSTSTAVKFAWPLVILGAGFIICLILSIVFHSQLTEARKQLDELETDQALFVTQEQRSNPDVQSLIGTVRDSDQYNSVTGLLQSRNNSLKGIIGANPDEPLSEIRAWNRENNATAGLRERIRSLDADLTAVQQQLQQKEQTLANRDDEIQSQQEQIQTLSTQLANAKQAVDRQYQAQTTVVNNVEQQLSSMEQDVTQEVSRTRQELEQRISELRTEADDLRQQKNTLQQRLNTLLAKPGIESLGQPVAVPDGRITAIISNQSKAYINLGSNKHLQLGMRFEVFGSDELVPYDPDEFAPPQGDGGPEQTRVIALSRGTAVVRTGGEEQGPGLSDMRGKATVQVIEIQKDRALVRVVRKDPDAQIKAGDVLVNVAYDATREVVFHVHGRFDMNGDGQFTASDRNQVESLITQWGGKVVDELNYEVDFLVLGQRPDIPEGDSGRMVSPRQMQQREAARAAAEEYQKIASAAQQLSIPVLNKNRFLALVGYYEGRGE